MNGSKILTKRFRVGAFSALAVGGLLFVGVNTASARSGADDAVRSTSPAAAVVADDDGTPDQGRGDVGVSTTTPRPTVAPTTAPTIAPPTTSRPNTPTPATSTRAIPVAGVGMVVITERPLGLVSVTPASGFTSRSEASAREVHVKFFDSAGGRIDVQAEIEDGAVRVRVRDRRTQASNRSATTTRNSPTTAVRGADDHGGRGRGSDDLGADDHGGDRSGHGTDDSGRDDSGRDDSSGHGSDD